MESQSGFGKKAAFALILAAFSAGPTVQASAASFISSFHSGPRGPSMNSIGPRGPNFDGPRRHFDGPRRPHIKGGGVIIEDTIVDDGDSHPTRKVVKKTKKKENRITRRSNAPVAGELRFIPDELIIEFAGNPNSRNIDQFANSFRLTRVESQRFELTNSTMYRWRIPDPARRSVVTMIHLLEGDSRIRFIAPNYLSTLSQTEVANASANAPSVEGDPAQYAVSKMHLPRAHSLAKGEKILVAVIDSEIDTAHPELAGVVSEKLDTLKDVQPHAHGTAIAGAIASHSRLMGVAPSARILAIAAFGTSGGGAEGTTFNILKGLDWAASKGARVVNMSFAGPEDPALGRAIAAAHKKGMVLIAAAGNAGPQSPPLFPAADPNVIAVTATDAQDNLFAGANHGGYIAVAAPGVDILLPSPGASYQVTTGTSFAAAHVSGIVALMLERKPELTPEHVRKILTSTAKDLGPKGPDPQFGAGLADAYRAVMGAEGKTTAEAEPVEAVGVKSSAR